MSRKDYVAIAKAFAARNILSTDCEWAVGARDMRVSLIEEFCRFLENDNPRFDRERFVRACNGEK